MTEVIERNPEVMVGKPVIRGTRVTIEAILKRLAEGYTIKDLLEEYPHLTEEEIKKAVEEANKSLFKITD